MNCKECCCATTGYIALSGLQTAVSTGVCAGIGDLSARLLGVNPTTGLVFGAIQGAVGSSIELIGSCALNMETAEKFKEANCCAKLALVAVTFFAGSSVAYGATNALGGDYSMSFYPTALQLSGMSLGLGLGLAAGVALVVGVAASVTACVAGSCLDD